jgi:DNA (cytosine-5)-methyltransferase 1
LYPPESETLRVVVVLGWTFLGMSQPFFAREFEELRVQAGLSRQKAAELIGLPEETIARYESGRSRASPIAIQQLKLFIEGGKAKGEVERQTEFTFIDLFAGIGGLRLGFESIGGRCVFTSEWDKYCRKTYLENFSIDHEFGGDVREFSREPRRIPRHDVLLAGFPCQPFSLAGVSKKNALGRPHGFLCDTQGTLFFDIEQIIAHHRPAAFLLENVKHLERHDGGRTFATILNSLTNKLGYSVQHRVINAEAWVPQRRERIFIVGFRDATRFNISDIELPPPPWPKLGAILEPHEKVDPKYTLTAHLWGYLKSYREKHVSKGNGFGYSLFGPDDVSRTLSQRYHKDGSEILIRQPRRRPRRLTPRECARLMGFDRPGRPEFKIPVSDTQAYRQFGNAVVVPVVEAVAAAMRPHILEAVGGAEEKRSVDPLDSSPPIWAGFAERVHAWLTSLRPRFAAG